VRRLRGGVARPLPLLLALPTLVAADGRRPRGCTPHGWVCGRLGCALVHDHVGTPSEFVLAVRFPNGPRHDLGLYEFLYTVVILVPAVVILDRRSSPPGTSVAVLALLYAPVRFLLDFLRQTDLSGADVRYHGLTVAQYGSIVLAGIGLSLIIRIRRRGSPVLTGRAEGTTDHSSRLRQRVTQVHHRAQGKRPSDRRSLTLAARA